MKIEKYTHIIVSLSTILIILFTYFFPFIFSRIDVEGNDIAWEQFVILVLFLTPAIIIFSRKIQSPWAYIYPIILLILMIGAILQKDALSGGFVIIFTAFFSIICSILLLTKTKNRVA